MKPNRDFCSKIAKKYGTIVSYDLNYRPSLWKSIGGQDKAQEVNREIAKYVDVMIGNEEDFTACLGFEVEGVDEEKAAAVAQLSARIALRVGCLASPVELLCLV